MLPEAWAPTMHYSFRFILAALAVWRLTHLVAKEDGPWDLFGKFRSRFGQRMLGKMVSCFNCLSLWVALPLALFVGGSVLEMLVCWLALSGAAVFLERAGREPFEFKIEENEDGMLRQDGGRAVDDQPERHR